MAILADAIVTACLTGKLLLDGQEIQLDPKEWIDIVKTVLGHVDGPAKSQHELTGANGGPLVIKGYVTINPDDWDKTDSDIRPATVAD